MQPLKLHLKTTLLVSAITLTVMVALLLIISVRLVELMRREEMTLTEIGAISLAEHLSQATSLADATKMERATALVRAGRRDAVEVRIWEAKEKDGSFAVVWSSSEADETDPMPANVAASLNHDKLAKIETGRLIETRESPYRVFAPIPHRRGAAAAVEITDHIDGLPALLKRSAGAVGLLALIAVALIALATYLLYRDLVYRPIERLLEVMNQTKSGRLNVRAPERRADELGRLSHEFNAMLGQIQEMTTERERQQEILQERVHEATAQVEQRNEQLAATNQELWNTARRLTQLERLAAAEQTAAQFAHEVGTPLNLISCHAQLMQSEAATGSLAERADIIVEQTDRIERIVRRMLDRTRSETAEHSPLDLNAMIRKVGEATRPMLNDRGVDVELALDEQLPRVAGDGDRLHQLFINLINNSIDAMPQGGKLVIASEVVADSDGSLTHALISIADSGCGMSREVQMHIFDPLYTTKARGKGTGLGLVVVNQVMQEHGGSITVESSPGSGSRFQLSFPALVPARAII
ncbi:MAG: ATP-binding protein [Acidobacteriota bacterium]